jgi:hypothetical protein
MGAEEINFIALPVAILMALVGGPLALRKAGFPLGKIVFGTLAVTVAALAVAGVITSIQRKTATEMLPLAWLVPATIGFVLWRLKQSSP